MELHMDRKGTPIARTLVLPSEHSREGTLLGFIDRGILWEVSRLEDQYRMANT